MSRIGMDGAVDRDRPLRFRFDGCEMTGLDGDTLASALIANGVKVVGRSFKYHRPRGIFATGQEEPNALVRLRTGNRAEPNVKATTVQLYDGLEAWSQNRFPSLRFDLLGALNGLASPLLGAGFYYKTFMWPRGFWEKLYEPLIRRAAGLGRASTLPDPDSYEKANAFCDLLVIGGGPAGLAATLEAGRSGLRVILCDADFALGGQLLSDDEGTRWLDASLAELNRLPNVTLLSRTCVFGAYDGTVYGAVESLFDAVPEPAPDAVRQRMWRIVAPRAVLATGAIERPMLFDRNDLPGVMLAGAVKTYVRRFAAAPGRRIVFCVNNDEGWRSAAACAVEGIEIAAIIDTRPSLPTSTAALQQSLSVPVHLGAHIVRANGRPALSSVDIVTANGRKIRLRADCLAVSGGWNPNIGLTTHLGARPAWNEISQQFVAGERPEGMNVVGAAAGTERSADCIAHGASAGRHVARNGPFSEDAYRDVVAFPASSLPQMAKGKVFVDLQHDVTARDVHIAWREGFRAVEHLKRYTTLGMATDQGRTSNFLGLALMAELSGNSVPGSGTTTQRPPAAPVAIGALAGEHRGRHFRPTRKSATHDWATARRTPMIEAGLWMRAQYYPEPGDADWLATACREAAAVRTSVGICDVSTLGKIDVQGLDAGAFLDFVYANMFSTLAIGRARYGLMLREDGFVFDDGTTARIGVNQFVMSTTTANAEAVMEHLEYVSQVLRPDLDVQLASITEQWAQFSIAGPDSRKLIARLLEGSASIEDADLPHMSVRAVRLSDGTPARLFRLSFSGERAFELAVPASRGAAVWASLLDQGRSFGISAYGTEALAMLRIEKGHVAGPELDGNTTAHDLGLGKLLSTKKDFIGRVLAGRTALTDPDRPSLVGLRPVEPGIRINAGALLIPLGRSPVSGADDGRLTSTAFSPTLGHWIALGLLKNGPGRHGERMVAFDPIRNATATVEICAPVFIDPKGDRVRG